MSIISPCIKCGNNKQVHNEIHQQNQKKSTVQHVQFVTVRMKIRTNKTRFTVKMPKMYKTYNKERYIDVWVI